MSMIYTQLSILCNGKITSHIKDTNTFEVSITHSPLGPLMNPVYCGASFQPGLQGNYKKGDLVQAMLKFNFGGMDNKITDLYKDGEGHILGAYTERSMVEMDVQNPLTAYDVDNVTFLNKHSKAGIVATHTGEVRVVAGGMFMLIKALGHGVHENEARIHAQNHSRVIANASVGGNTNPTYLSREYFGLFDGKSLPDKITRVTADSHPLCYKRFVTQSRAIDKWVSTCEGAWNPWVGPNNGSHYREIDSQILLSKVVNHGDSRITIEMGKPGTSFIKLRVDDVLLPERKSSSAKEATPATVGNRLKFEISDKGAVVFTAVGDAGMQTTKSKFKMSIALNGDLTILSAGKIILSHGDNDIANNSVTLDPDLGVDVIAKKGFRVNGSALVNEEYLKWMDINKKALCQTVAIGAPSPMSLIAEPAFAKGMTSIQDQKGFTTRNEGAPATKTIISPDNHISV